MIRRLAAIAALALLVSAALFAVGVNAEDDEHHDKATAHVESEGEHDEAAEAAEAAEQAEGSHDDDAEEAVLGIDVESPATVAVVVAASVVLAALVWFRTRRWVWMLVLAFSAAAASFDVAEALHQLDESNSSLAAVAIAVAALHLVAASAGGLALRGEAARP